MRRKKNAEDVNDVADVQKLEAEVAKLRSALQQSSEFWAPFVQTADLVGFLLCEVDDRKMTLVDLGRLAAIFNSRFLHCLLVQPHMANDMHGRYRLLAVKRHTTVAGAPGTEKKIPRAEYEQMRNFVAGFEAAIMSQKKNP